jgi:hypothetical protein
MAAMLSNESVLAAWAVFKNAKKMNLLASIRRDFPELVSMPDERVFEFGGRFVSDHQSKAGGFLEGHVEKSFTVPFQKQVCINKDGVVIDRKGGKPWKILDIVFGTPVVGTHVSNYAVLSLKTTSRERASQDDDWSRRHPPKLFLYGTLSDDYPQPDKFGESETRKLVCATPKKSDGRAFKLGFGDIEAEVMRP